MKSHKLKKLKNLKDFIHQNIKIYEERFCKKDYIYFMKTPHRSPESLDPV